MSEWLQYCADKRLITDVQNLSGLENFEGFVDHRHDQSIFSLLTKTYQLEAFRDPSQYGNSLIERYPNSPYGQIINSTRMQNLSRKAPLKKNMINFLNNLGCK